MRVRLVVLSALLVAASALAAPALAQPAKAKACSSGSTAKTASYQLALKLGPRQEMYMPSEVQARKIKSGQVMLGGSMAMVDAKPGYKVFDLAVYVCTKSGAIVTQLKPTIEVRAMGAKPQKMDVAMMAAVGKGLSDYHYGNDVALKPGAKVTVIVTVKGQRAVLHATAPKSRRLGHGDVDGLRPRGGLAQPPRRERDDALPDGLRDRRGAGFVIATWRGWGNLATIAVAVGLAYVFGYALTLLPLVRGGVPLRRAAGLAFAADTLSITVMEIVDNLVVLVVPGAMDAGLGDALFWGSLALALAVAWVAAFPVNRWLIARGRGHAVVHAHH